MNNIIFLAEDDATIAEIYAMALKKENFRVETFGSGQEVLKKIKEVQEGQSPCPNLLLLDLILPDMNGVEVLKKVREHTATKSMKVFILSNQESSQMAHDAKAKPDKFIVKANITPTQLVSVVKEELQ